MADRHKCRAMPDHASLIMCSRGLWFMSVDARDMGRTGGMLMSASTTVTHCPWCGVELKTLEVRDEEER